MKPHRWGGTLKRWIFAHYGWLALVSGGIALALTTAYGGEDRIGLMGAAISGTLGFAYFVQQQRLAETELFHQLFTDFNTRYRALNGKLVAILNQEDPLTPQQRDDIVDYFNLCAEEYLFYSHGVIPLEVWQAWCRGMAWYLRRHPFKDVWNEEMDTDSYYGLTLQRIINGAG